MFARTLDEYLQFDSEVSEHTLYRVRPGYDADRYRTTLIADTPKLDGEIVTYDGWSYASDCPIVSLGKRQYLIPAEWLEAI